MINVTVNDYKDLLKCLDKSISNLSVSLCRSETYGYCSNRNKLTQLVQLKDLVKTSFNFDNLKTIYNTHCIHKNLEEFTYFNKVEGDLVQLLKKKVYKIIRLDKEFRFKLPSIPFKGGYYIENIFIDCDIESNEDYNTAICILNSIKYKNFFDFKFDEVTKEIYSKSSVDYIEEFEYETKEINTYDLVQCVKYKDIKKLIEKTI